MGCAATDGIGVESSINECACSVHSGGQTIKSKRGAIPWLCSPRRGKLPDDGPAAAFETGKGTNDGKYSLVEVG